MSMEMYRLTDEEFNRLMEASKPVPYMVIGGVEPESPYDKAKRVWLDVASRVHCDIDSIGPANTGNNRDFMAAPLNK